MNLPFTAGDELEADDLSNLCLNGGQFAVSTGSSNAYVLTLSNPALTALSTGMTVSFKANFTNTGASTLTIGSLGVKIIYKGISTDLVAGDIVNGQVVTLKYDGTAFQLQSIPSNLHRGIFKNGVAAMTNSTGTQNIAHGLGCIPKKIKITALGSAASGGSVPVAMSIGVYNGTTTSQLQVVSSGTSGWLLSYGRASTYIISINDGVNNGNTLVATVTFDATNIILATTKGGAGLTACDLMWEAEA